MIKLKLKDGSVREIPQAAPASEIIKDIGMGLYKAACCVKLDGQVCDMRTVVDRDCEFEVMTFDSKAGKETFWHTASHLMAQAVKNLYPEAKLARGPATETGFYYDFEVAKPFAPADLVKIQAEMKKLAKEGYALERFELPVDEALKLMEEKNEAYKVELIHKHDDKGEKLSFYKQGDFVDLCAGPHLMSVAPIKAVKLLSCTGAYWGKAEDGRQLSRIYGTAFPKASLLEEFLKQQEEAKLRDHNKIGRELEYFTTVDYIGQGLPILLPKGARVIQLLQRWVEDTEQAHGCLLTKTPYFAKRDLYKISGHWDHYLDGMFIMGDPHDEEKECFALRPMTCPFQYQVFLNRQRSYRDLPMRLVETSTLFRNEDSGEMHGLIRVRQFTISEGHYILRPDQLEEEFKGCLELAKYMLDTVGLLENCTFRFSQWDPANPNNKYEGTAEQWNHAQDAMKRILDDIGLDYEIGIDEAAFYGPKLDIQYKNVFGKEDTIVTLQIDMLLAEKFGMYYVDKDGQKKLPYIIHRTSLGCYERTLAYMLEHFAGVLPLWLAPEQARIMPIGEEHIEYAQKLADKMTAMGMRVTVDRRSENIGPKIKAARLERIPYMVIIGDKEVESGTVSVRSRKEGELGAMPCGNLLDKLMTEISTKSK
ncbi:threonine--tRNA ligase [Ruminococcus sp. Marseille-P6503]|uniref:threonine--tRNA ligase n=1 Tax=Ruminococcus sp. Marseille-P6503 TaxID=2364796 RepID=UPI000F5399EB|nr:threonine--tRNA ligase [Ruminococcus sp. Marseille-P6503]